MQEARIVGLGAAIIVNRKLVWSRGYGFADRERAVPFTQDTIMNVASISKTIIGAALMRTVQDGKLSLDEDINKYLPFKVANPSFPNEPITLRQLATHTSRPMSQVEQNHMLTFGMGRHSRSSFRSQGVLSRHHLLSPKARKHGF